MFVYHTDKRVGDNALQGYSMDAFGPFVAVIASRIPAERKKDGWKEKKQ